MSDPDNYFYTDTAEIQYVGKVRGLFTTILHHHHHHHHHHQDYHRHHASVFTILQHFEWLLWFCYNARGDSSIYHFHSLHIFFLLSFSLSLSIYIYIYSHTHQGDFFVKGCVGNTKCEMSDPDNYFYTDTAEIQYVGKVRGLFTTILHHHHHHHHQDYHRHHASVFTILQHFEWLLWFCYNIL